MPVVAAASTASPVAASASATMITCASNRRWQSQWHVLLMVTSYSNRVGYKGLPHAGSLVDESKSAAGKDKKSMAPMLCVTFGVCPS